MSNKKRVYIIGAGASQEAGLPTGEGLKDVIANILTLKETNIYAYTFRDRDMLFAIEQHIKQNDVLSKNKSHYYKAAELITNAIPQAISIDHLIHSHNGNKDVELCGKLAIVKAILESEKGSSLCINDSNNNRMNYGNIKDTWYNLFWKLLHENCDIDHFSERLKSIVFIIFNYDRCVEHFLFNSIQNFYDVSQDIAADLLKNIEIYHPYGVVGNLRWQDGNYVDFGTLPHTDSFLSVASRIKTFTEGTVPDSSEILAIRKHIATATQLVFLGFAFHPLNLELLFLKEPVKPAGKVPINVFGTGKGQSESNSIIICDNLHDSLLAYNYKPFFNLQNNFKCHELFIEYSKMLSFA